MVHAMVWTGIYLLYSFILSFEAGLANALLINLLIVSLFIVAYYLLRHVQIPYYKRSENAILFILSLVVSSMFLYGIYAAGWKFFLDYFIVRPWIFDCTKIKIITVLILRFYSPSIALLALESFYHNKQEQKRKQQLEKEILVNELNYLKAKVNPHFLFNTLNNLYSHVVEKSPQAPDMILSLSSMLDYILYKSQQPQVLLSEEFEAIQHFLDLEQIRQPDTKVSFQTSGDKSAKVSPLLMLTLLEHVFKYHVAANSVLSVLVEETTGQVTLQVLIDNQGDQESTIDPIKKVQDFQAIQRQLALTYPEQYTLISKPAKTVLTILLSKNLVE